MFKHKVLVFAEIWSNTAAELTEVHYALLHNQLLDIIKVVKEDNAQHKRTTKKPLKQQPSDVPPPHVMSIILFVDQHELNDTEHNWATRLTCSLRASGLECRMSYPRRSSQEWARFDLRKPLHHTR